MLAGVVARDLAPGSNFPDTSGHVWQFLLPTLEPARALCLGAVPEEVLEALDRGAGQLTHSAPSELTHIVETGAVELLVLDAGPLRALAQRPELVGVLRRGLASTATVVVHGRGATRSSSRRVAAAAAGVPLADRPVAVLGTTGRPAHQRAHPGALAVPTPRSRAAAPRTLRRLDTARRLVQARVGRLLPMSRPPSSVRAHASDLAPVRPVLARGPQSAEVLMLSRHHALLEPPAWVRELLRESGVTGAIDRWALAPPRGYRSQKVLFLLGPEGGEPEIVVKVTQQPRFNERLDNEVNALRRVAEAGLADPGTVPTVLGTGRHAGLSVVVESAWAGVPFRELSTARPDCPFAATALEWFVRLGERSAAADTRPVVERRTEVDQLLDRYLAAFELAERHRDALLAYGEALGGEAVPTVFFHGDPGNWNLRTRADGTVGVLDWENAHPAGPPVWDVALFLATYGNFVTEAEGHRPTAETFAAHFRPGSDLRPLIDSALRGYGRRVGVGPTAIRSLLVLCWVHQALKEISRLPEGARPAGRWPEIVRRVLDEPALVEPPPLD